ncbi:monooxygenase [Angustibacter luteus]|uniref:Monooxygenase n=1 Tax=Angustibacter luteus TaxID=658456 RepID=A0ABW1JBP0_9ACTN
MPAAAPTVLLQLWGVDTRHVGSALTRMATTRRQLRDTPGLRFRKLLGTGSGRTFTVRDADPHRWGLLTVWDGEADVARYLAGHQALDSWDAVATERLDVRLAPLASRGRWSGVEPFGNPLPRKVDGPVASITRARIRPSKAVTFWRAVPPVSLDLQRVDGLTLALGIGEAPVGLQGTFSLWRSAEALTAFAHRRAPHAEAVRRTATEQWYAEELFARFQVRDVHGTLDHRPVEVGTRPDASPTSP